MRLIKIQTPIWSTMSVGIAENKIGRDGVDIEILYKSKNGERLFPHIYTISREIILMYPTQVTRGVKLYIVPIKTLSIKMYGD